MTTVLYSEEMYPDATVEREVFGSDTRLLVRNPPTLADLDPAECAEVDGLMLFRLWATAEDFARFPRLRAIVRMGVSAATNIAAVLTHAPLDRDAVVNKDLLDPR